MITGGSIIMPMLIRIEATAMSMIRNGTKIRKPISKARLSSRQHEGRRQGGQRDIGGIVGRLGMGHVEEQLEVGVAHMRQHEFLHRHQRLVKPCSVVTWLFIIGSMPW